MPPTTSTPSAAPARSQPSEGARGVARGLGERGRLRVAAVPLGLSLVAACFAGSDGLYPPGEELYFPTAVVISPGRSTLYVTNSDFDLQYNSGTVQAAQLADAQGGRGMRSLVSAVSDRIAAGDDDVAACAAAGSRPNSNPILHPGPCEPVDFQPFVRAYATIGAFANAAVLLPRGDGPGLRLFVSVRGDPSVNFFDVVDDRDPSAPVSPCGASHCLECGAPSLVERCAPGHLVGSSANTNLRGLTLPVEPSSLAAAHLPTGDAIVVPHLTSQSASLVVNRWAEAGPLGPSLEHVLRNLPDAPSGIVHLPPPALVAAAGGSVAHRPAFLLSHRAVAVLSLVRYDDDARSRPPRPFLTGLETLGVTLTNDSSDGRGIAIDATERQRCEASCAPGDLGCLRSCAELPLKLYIAGRRPSSLLVGSVHAEVADSPEGLSSVAERVTLEEAIPLPFGAAQVAVGSILGPSGELETRVFAASFDSRFVLVYDPRLRRIDNFIRTGRGPYGMAFDTGLDEQGQLRSYLWITHFTDSYIAAIDLDVRRASFGTPVLSFGPPKPPRGEQ